MDQLDLIGMGLQKPGHILESNVRVENKERAEDGIRDRVERAGSERSNCKRDQTNADQSIWCY